MTSRDNPQAYSLQPKNKFFEANRRVVDYEIRSGRTVSFFSEVDLTELEQLRHAAAENKPSYTALVVKAVGLALREFPNANRRICRRAWLSFLGPRQQQFHQCDVAVACERDIAGADGVAFVDIFRDADRHSLHEITAWLRDLATCDVQDNKQWRDYSRLISRLPSWLSALLIRLPYFAPGCWVAFRGAAALVSSPAKYGVDAVVGAWSWPLGVSFGFVRQRPVVRNDRVVPCPTFILTFNFDRRILAGGPAARFFNRIVQIIENAATELGPHVSTAEAPAAGDDPSCANLDLK